MINLVSTRRPAAPEGRRPAAPKSKPATPANAKAKQMEVVVIPAPEIIGVPKAKTTAKKPIKKPTSNKPVDKKPVARRPNSGPNPRVPNRVSIHDAARVENVRKRLDNLESQAQANAMPEALTARTLIAAVIVLLVAALLVPTLRGALEQNQQIAAQRAHLETSLAKSEQLDFELARWEDPNFIEAQARSRLGYVRPGDKVWRPIGGDILAEDLDPLTGVRVDEGVAGATAGQPWFEALLESFLVANGPIEQGPDDLDEILSRNRDN